MELDGNRGGSITVLGQSRQSTTSRGNEGDLGHGKGAVKQD
jgi:hypothetical protein